MTNSSSGAPTVVSHQFNGDQNFQDLHLWVIPVAIKGEEKRHTFSMLLDTGAQRTVIVPGVQETVGINKLEPGKVTGQGAGSSSYRQGTVENLEIASISLGSLQILIGNLPDIFSRYNIFGLLGADVLQKLCLEIDYPESLLVISKTTFLPSGN